MQPHLDLRRSRDVGGSGADEPFRSGQIVFPDRELDQSEPVFPIPGELFESGEE